MEVGSGEAAERLKRRRSPSEAASPETADPVKENNI